VASSLGADVLRRERERDQHGERNGKTFFHRETTRSEMYKAHG
jgi:hypothetical protein